MNLKIETPPLKITGLSVYSCAVDFNNSGSCSGKCKIIMQGDSVVFVNT